MFTAKRNNFFQKLNVPATCKLLAIYYVAGAMGFEPTIFPVTGGRVNRTTPRALFYIVGLTCPAPNF